MVTIGSEIRSEHFARFIESIPLGIHIWRLDQPEDWRSLRLIAANALIGKYLHKPTVEMIGKNILEVYPDAQESPILQRLQRVALAEKSYTDEVPAFGDPPDATFAARALPLPS